jgi:hypothetical protein
MASIMVRAQVGQQHEALRLVPGQHLRRVQARVVHQLRHLHEGAQFSCAGGASMMMRWPPAAPMRR